MEDWIARELAMADGQVMFPKWDAKRRGSSKYEVRFTYTLLRDNYVIQKKGFVWNVDLSLRLVGPLRSFEPVEAERRPRVPEPRRPPPKKTEEPFSLE